VVILREVIVRGNYPEVVFQGIASRSPDKDNVDDDAVPYDEYDDAFLDDIGDGGSCLSDDDNDYDDDGDGDDDYDYLNIMMRQHVFITY